MSASMHCSPSATKYEMVIFIKDIQEGFDPGQTFVLTRQVFDQVERWVLESCYTFKANPLQFAEIIQVIFNCKEFEKINEIHFNGDKMFKDFYFLRTAKNEINDYYNQILNHIAINTVINF